MRGTSSTVSRTIFLGSSVAWGALALILALGVHPSARPVGAADAKLTTPRVDDRLVTRAVNKLIKDAHLSKHALDDEISERGLHLFIKMLDNRKLYFTKDDIAELALFLASESSAYISGTVMICDGGQSLLGSGPWVEGLKLGARKA